MRRAFHNPALGKRIRVEHEDNANTMGQCVGHNGASAVDAEMADPGAAQGIMGGHGE